MGKPLKVYVLAGQSNMQGSAHKKTFAAIGDDSKTAPLLKEVLGASGEPIEADNGWVAYRTNRGGEQATLLGKVKVGYGFDDKRIGPEYGFGLFMDRSTEEPVLLIKTAWGGKSLAVDFRPPSSGVYQPSEREKKTGRGFLKEETGHYYRDSNPTPLTPLRTMTLHGYDATGDRFGGRTCLAERCMCLSLFW